MFELTNEQRKYFGINPIQSNWDKEYFKGDFYRPESFLYYENNVIRRQIVSTDSKYEEFQYKINTLNREFILAKTNRGKNKKLTPSTFEHCNPVGTYCVINTDGNIIIGNQTTQRTFYESDFDNAGKSLMITIKEIVNSYINTCPQNYLNEINSFNNEKRKNIKYKSGDFFRYKINRTLYGFGRIILDINKLRKNNLVNNNHGLDLLMGPPILIKIYAIISKTKDIDLYYLKKQPSLPSDYIMDNRIFYGDYELIGNLDLEDNDFDFPMSYGKSISHTDPSYIFLQWGLIHRSLPIKKFSKYLHIKRNGIEDINPYGYYSIGFNPSYNALNIADFLAGKNIFESNSNYKYDVDLRNPKNTNIRNEIMKIFGLDPNFDYIYNAKLSNTENIYDVIHKLNS